MSWQIFAGPSTDWDALVMGLGARTPFQFSAWADFRERFNWRSLRLVSSDNSRAVQLLTRKVGSLHVAWAAGGPLGDLSEDDLERLPGAVARMLGGKIHYLRVADHMPHDHTREQVFHRAGWSRPKRTIATNHTLIRSIRHPRDTADTGYSSNWSRNLRRGQRRDITAEIWAAPDSGTIARLHRDVESTKRAFVADWRTSDVALHHLISSFGERLHFVRAVDASGRTLSIRAATVYGSYAFDFLAATSNEGRKCYASNVAMHELLASTAAQGATFYDFGGVDPLANKGVYDFKHGAGGAEHHYVGEFEFVNPRIAKPVVSKLIAFRLSA